MSQLILLLCMFLGASAGSTGGGMKCLRIMLCFKFCYKELFALIHPRAVLSIKIGGRSVPNDIMRSVLGFMALYMGLFGLSSVLLGWPLLLAVLHNGGAAVLLALLVTIYYRLSAGGNLPVGGAPARAPAQGRG